MRLWCPEIRWHDDVAPILSIDYCHSVQRIATAASDKSVRIWKISNQNVESVLSSSSPPPPGSSSSSSSSSSPPPSDSDDCDLSNVIRSLAPHLIDFPSIDWLSTLSHSETINCVRFSPDGTMLAAAGDDKVITIWRREEGGEKKAERVESAEVQGTTEGSNDNNINISMSDEDVVITSSTSPSPSSSSSSSSSLSPSSPSPSPPLSDSPIPSAFDDSSSSFVGAERWLKLSTLRGVHSEIYDLSWSPDSKFLTAAFIDQHVTTFDISTCRVVQSIQDHSGFVQGVACDPLGEFLVSQSSDRTIKFYSKFPIGGGQKKVVGMGNQIYKLGGTVKMSSNHHLSTLSNTQSNSNSGNKRKEMDNGEGNGNGNVNGNDNPMEIDNDVSPPSPSKISSPSSDSSSSPSSPQPSSSNSSPSPSTPSASSSSSSSPSPSPSGNYYMYLDDSVGFFRRLSFSPDGQILVTPSGMFHNNYYQNNNSLTPSSATPSSSSSLSLSPSSSAVTPPPLHTSYVYSRYDLSKPMAHLPYPEPSVCVRFCPILFRLSSNHSSSSPSSRSSPISPISPLTSLPYRMMFSVATTRSVVIYSTSSPFPLCIIKHIHHASITDMTWQYQWDPLTHLLQHIRILISSHDGYVSIAHFNADEMGISFTKMEMDEHYKKMEKKRVEKEQKGMIKAEKPNQNKTMNIPSNVVGENEKGENSAEKENPNKLESSSAPSTSSSSSGIPFLPITQFLNSNSTSPLPLSSSNTINVISNANEPQVKKRKKTIVPFTLVSNGNESTQNNENNHSNKENEMVTNPIDSPMKDTETEKEQNLDIIFSQEKASVPVNVDVDADVPVSMMMTEKQETIEKVIDANTVMTAVE